MANNNSITLTLAPEYVKKAKILEAELGLKNRSALFRYLLDKELGQVVGGDNKNA